MSLRCIGKAAIISALLSHGRIAALAASQLSGKRLCYVGGDGYRAERGCGLGKDVRLRNGASLGGWASDARESGGVARNLRKAGSRGSNGRIASGGGSNGRTAGGCGRHAAIAAIIVIAIALAAAIAALAGCGGSGGGGSGGGGSGGAGGGESQAMAFVDMAGREVRLDGPAARVVVLTAADCETLFAIGAGDAVVGRGTYCDYPPEALGLPEVSSGGETNIEQIIALAPQAVIVSKMAQTVEQADALEKAGIRVIATDAQDIAGTYDAIRLVGKAVGKDAEAEALVGEMQGAFAEARSKAEGAKGAPGAGAIETVYFEVSPLSEGLWTAGAGTFMDELAALCGIENIFPDVDGWAMVSEEQVITRDPGCIVTVAMYFGDGPAPVDEILGRAGWQTIKAVAEKRVYHVDSDAFARPGPRLADAARELSSLVYGS